MKVLIVLDNIHTGGISKSLLNCLPHIAKKIECDLLIFNYKNLDKSLIPLNVNLIIPDENLHILGMSQDEIRKYSKLKFALRALLVIISRLVNGNFSRNILFKFIKKLKGYDLAISYSQDVGWKTISTGCNHFVLDKVEAKHKAAFIHCDYEYFGGYDKRQEQVYGEFDKVVCVSESCAKSFSRMFPSLKKKCIVCENFTNVDEIGEKINPGCYEYDSALKNIVSVCRLGEEKGLLRTVNVLGKLYREGYKNFKWTVVGDGPDRDAIEHLIEKNKLGNNIGLVGRTSNPFYYVKNANFFLLPSFHEAAPMVFGECQALGVPILTTATISAKELVENRGIGVVCDNNEDGIYDALKSIFDGEIMMEKINQNVIDKLNYYAEKQMDVFLECF